MYGLDHTCDCYRFGCTNARGHSHTHPAGQSACYQTATKVADGVRMCDGCYDKRLKRLED